MRNHKLLFTITLSYFLLGFVNIHFALLGIFCMTIPFFLVFKTKKKTWCQGYCPRAALYTTTLKHKGWKTLNTPNFFVHGEMRWVMLTYFAVSLFFITMTTIAVAKGVRAPMNYLRFFVIYPIPFSMPQLIQFSKVTPWITHLAYRFYSMMMTTTILGFTLGLIYRPRTWCTICPVGTMSDSLLKKKRR